MPAVAVGVLSAVGSVIAGNKAKQAAQDAANQQNQLARDEMARAEAEKQRWWGQLSPEMADYKANIPQQLISPKLTAEMYDFFAKNTDAQAAIDRTRLSQELARKGLDTSGIYGRALSDFAAKQADVKTGEGLQLAKDAAVTNYNAQNQAKQYLLSLMMSGYGGGQSAVNQGEQIGASLGADAIAGQLAGRNAQINAYSQALAALMSGMQGGMGGGNWSQWSHAASNYQMPQLGSAQYPTQTAFK